MENDVRTEGMYEYTVRFGEATIVRHLREYDFEKHDTVIPAYLGSYPVVEIGIPGTVHDWQRDRSGGCACNRRGCVCRQQQNNRNQIAENA